MILQYSSLRYRCGDIDLLMIYDSFIFLHTLTDIDSQLASPLAITGPSTEVRDLDFAAFGCQGRVQMRTEATDISALKVKNMNLSIKKVEYHPVKLR